MFLPTRVSSLHFYCYLCPSVSPLIRSEMRAVHSLATLNIHSAYVIKLIDTNKQTCLCTPRGRPELEEPIWVYFTPSELRCHDFHSGGRLGASEITAIASALWGWWATSLLSLFTPGELVRSTASSNFIMTSKRLGDRINKICTLKELTFEWISKLLQENFYLMALQ